MIEFSIHWSLLLVALGLYALFFFFWGVCTDVPLEQDAPYRGEHFPEDFK
jgi:hypothetical protein